MLQMRACLHSTIHFHKKINIQTRSQIYALFGRAISQARWQLMVEQPVMDI